MIYRPKMEGTGNFMNENKNPIVSVIVPVYNTEKYIDKCIQSIVNQTYESLEIVVIDDGSTDKSTLICDKWKDKDSRIKVIHKKNGGLSDARNIGIDNSSGEFVCFVDSDDIISPNMVEDLMNIVLCNNNDIVCCNFARFIDGEEIKYTRYSKTRSVSQQEAIKLLLKDEITNHVCNKLFRKQVFKDIRFPIGRKYEDIGVMYKLILNSDKIIITDGKYYGYTIRNESITNTVKQEAINDMIYLVNERYNELSKRNMYFEELIKSRMRYIYIYHLKAVLNQEIYYSKTLNQEYLFFKKNMNLRRLCGFLKHENMRTKINKFFFTISKEMFYKIKKRNNRNKK